MAARFTCSGSQTTHCDSFAAACSPARIRVIMDTVSILAVSIFVCLISLVMALTPLA